MINAYRETLVLLAERSPQHADAFAITTQDSILNTEQSLFGSKFLTDLCKLYR
jgi:hypothetical protein